MQAANLTGTEPLSPDAAINVAALRSYLQAHLPALCRGEMSIERFRGGQSNPTMVLAFDGVKRLVIRKKPAGKLLPSAHAVDREFRVTSALRGQGVPLATPHLLCEEEDILGTIFYVMDYVEGRSFWEPKLPEASVAQRQAIYGEMVAKIAALHQVDYLAVGLEGFGKPENYVARQVARWSKQYRASETHEIAAMDRLIKWLPENIPPQRRSAIIHGDYRIDNMIFHPQEPRIVALVDWELSTIGDPMADFAYHTLTWLLPEVPYRGLRDCDLPKLGIPELRGYRDSYLALTGQENVSDREWYALIAYSFFRVAAIRQGIMKRVVDGTAASAYAEAAGRLAGDVAALGWRFAEKSAAS